MKEKENAILWKSSWKDRSASRSTATLRSMMTSNIDQQSEQTVRVTFRGELVQRQCLTVLAGVVLCIESHPWPSQHVQNVQGMQAVSPFWDGMIWVYMLIVEHRAVSNWEWILLNHLWNLIATKQSASLIITLYSLFLSFLPLSKQYGMYLGLERVGDIVSIYSYYWNTIILIQIIFAW